MHENSKNKNQRILGIYRRLVNGYIINKAEMAEHYHVNEKSIQRDIEDIREFFEDELMSEGIVQNIIYDKKVNGYRIENLSNSKLSNQEILAICKILLESRAFAKHHIKEIISKLEDTCTPKENYKAVKQLLENELFHYTEPNHACNYMDTLWLIGQAIQSQRYLSITYQKLSKNTDDNKMVVIRKIRPLAIMFSEFYFYVTAFIDGMEQSKLDNSTEISPTIYRIDRIIDAEILKEHFRIPYRNRFEEGEFRKRVQFMYGGKLKRIKFLYKGVSVEAVLDRLPTAKILEKNDSGYIITAEVYGNGVDMWLRSQGDYVELL